MKIKVEKILKIKDEVFVAFSCLYGSSIVRWVGENPTYEAVYDVELEIDDVLIWGDTIFMTDKRAARVTQKDNQFIIVGSFIDSDEDGCFSICIGDSIVLLEVENAPENIHSFIECYALDVSAYPIKF